MNYRDKANSWLNNEYFDEDFKNEIRNLLSDEKELEDRFYKDLEFGTAGIRGKIGAGSNRLNKYIIRLVTQGYANHLKKSSDNPKVAIARDSRHKSDEFAMEAGLVLAANGIKVYYFEQITTTPELSYAVRQLGCDGGIVITASHNPPEYNGYKLYDKTGCQLLTYEANSVIEEVKNVAIDQAAMMSLEQAQAAGKFEYIGEDLYYEYYRCIKSLMVNSKLTSEEGDRLSVIYTPLHGTGGRPVINVLSLLGFKNVHPVEEQMIPDGDFPTAKSPNPESEPVFELSKKLGDVYGADILLATDPDSDRVGVLVSHEGRYEKIDGNQMGALLANYLLENKKDVESKILVDTIVTSHLTDKIAREYGAKLVKTLTGFKYIGETINNLSENEHYVLGFEESYGYMSGYHVRDKDAVNASALICEMALYYKMKGMTLIHVLSSIYEKYGYFVEYLHSIDLEGKEGLEKIGKVMSTFRNLEKDSFAGEKTKSFTDYKSKKVYAGSDIVDTGLPSADVIKIVFEDESWFALRPSGTEPKLKIYFSAVSDSSEGAQKRLEHLKSAAVSLI